MLYNIGRLLCDKPSSLPGEADLRAFLALLLEVAKSQSLQVSISALHLWAKLLGINGIATSPATLSLVGEVLETCSQRLVKYEVFPQDSTHPSILFLNEDIETIPERHAFLGNYSRFCHQIVELIVEQQPIDALYHILGQADQVLEHAYDGEPPFHRKDSYISLISRCSLTPSLNLPKKLHSIPESRCAIFCHRGGTEGLS